MVMLLLAACSKEEQVMNQADKKEDVKEETLDLTKEEVQEILKNNLDSIFKTLDQLGSENQWGNANPADLNKIKPAVLPYITDEFANTILQELSEGYFCECDNGMKPKYSSDVHFLFKQANENELKITALEPATEMNNMGSVWGFELVKEDQTWKMNKWDYQSLEGQDIKLKKEEAQELLKSENETPEFVEEYQSEEAGGKAYVFKMKTDESDRLVAISSKDTHLVYDFAIEKKVADAEGNNSATIEITNLYEEFYEKLHFGLTKEELVEKFGQPKVEKALSNELELEYSDARYTISGVSNQVYKVEILGEKASGFYKDFDEVIKSYNPNPVSAEYFDETGKDENGYYLKMDDGYNKLHTFTSDQEDGNPIKSVSIQILDYR